MSMFKSKFIMVKETSPEKFSEKLSELVSDGWELHGDPFNYKDNMSYFCQSLHRLVPVSNDNKDAVVITVMSKLKSDLEYGINQFKICNLLNKISIDTLSDYLDEE